MQLDFGEPDSAGGGGQLEDWVCEAVGSVGGINSASARISQNGPIALTARSPKLRAARAGLSGAKNVRFRSYLPSWRDLFANARAGGGGEQLRRGKWRESYA